MPASTSRQNAFAVFRSSLNSNFVGACAKGKLDAWDEFKHWERCAEEGGRPRDVEELVEDDVDQCRHATTFGAPLAGVSLGGQAIDGCN
jgi:hypothetical protein